MAEQAISFEEYVAFLTESLASFKIYWEDNTEVNPEHFPERMYVSEWDEQLNAWLESINETKVPG